MECGNKPLVLVRDGPGWWYRCSFGPVQQHAQSSFAQAEETTGAGLPQFVKDEFDAFLECGILAHGFLHLRCGDCGHDKLLTFICKRRGFCPSCGARRMAQTAAHLVDLVGDNYLGRCIDSSDLLPLMTRCLT